MAYIIVDESILGYKLNKLSERLGCSQNEAIGILVRLWLFGIRNADENGNLMYIGPKEVTDAIRPGLVDEEDCTSLDEDTVVRSLIDSEWISEESGHLHLYGWEQMYKIYADNRKRERHTREMREWRKSRKDSLGMKAPAPTEVKEEPKPEPPKDEKPKKVTRIDYGTDFEEFWKVYPRAKDKGEAYAKYMARLKDGWSPAQLIEAAKGYAEECIRQKTDQKYIKHAKTFLSEKTPFTDYLKKNGETGMLNSSGDDGDEIADVMEAFRNG